MIDVVESIHKETRRIVDDMVPFPKGVGYWIMYIVLGGLITFSALIALITPMGEGDDTDEDEGGTK